MRIDVFCNIVDNYGDAGVCWRLVRRLAETAPSAPLNHSNRDCAQDSIRLFCDDLELLNQLAGTDAKIFGKSLGIEILTWADSQNDALIGLALPDLIIESFGCDLPPSYLAQVSQNTSCVILNLEYLSAEDWIESHHGLSSPSGKLKKYFFFPGFSKNTGTVLQGKLPKQGDLLPASLKAVWDKTRSDALKICLFCYDTPEMRTFVELFKYLDQKIDFLVCYGQASQLIKEIKPSLMGHLASSNIQCISVPFISQDDFDYLLSLCDLNIVRGEDSFVRAGWAAKPFIWQIYPQDDGAHHLKLEAFLDKYLKNSPLESSQAIRQAMRLSDPKSWLNQLPEMTKYAIQWRKKLDELTLDGDLALQIRKFLKKI